MPNRCRGIIGFAVNPEPGTRRRRGRPFCGDAPFGNRTRRLFAAQRGPAANPLPGTRLRFVRPACGGRGGPRFAWRRRGATNDSGLSPEPGTRLRCLRPLGGGGKWLATVGRLRMAIRTGSAVCGFRRRLTLPDAGGIAGARLDVRCLGTTKDGAACPVPGVRRRLDRLACGGNPFGRDVFRFGGVKLNVAGNGPGRRRRRGLPMIPAIGMPRLPRGALASRLPMTGGPLGTYGFGTRPRRALPREDGGTTGSFVFRRLTAAGPLVAVVGPGRLRRTVRGRMACGGACKNGWVRLRYH